MDRVEVVARVRSIINQFIEMGSEPVEMNASLTGELGLSSLEIITIITEVEDYYGITIPAQEYKSIVIVDDYIDCIIKYANGK